MRYSNYVRIDNDGRGCIGIGKIVNYTKDTIYINMNNKYNLPISFNKNSITKYSKNIIDLIELGDFVNGKEVIEIDDFKEFIGTDKSILREKDIKTIVTKEQFSNMEYRMGE